MFKPQNIILLFLLVLFVIPVIYSEGVYFSDGSYLPGKLLKRNKSWVYWQVGPWRVDIPQKYISITTQIIPERVVPLDFLFKNDARLIQTINKQMDNNNPAIFHNLIKLLDHPHWQIRLRAFHLLKYCNCQANLFFLFNLLETTTWGEQALANLLYIEAHNHLSIRKKIVCHIRKIRTFSTRHVPVILLLGKLKQKFFLLQQLAEHEDMGVVKAALQSLSNFGEEGLECITPFLEVDDEAILIAAIKATAATKIKKTVPLLLPYLQDEREKVRDCTCLALQHLTQQNIANDYSLWQRWWRQNSRFQKLTTDLQILADENNIGRLEKIIYKMSNSGCNIADIIAFTQHRQPQIRKIACKALQKFRGDHVISALVPLLEDEDTSVQKMAYRSLQKITNWPLPPLFQFWQMWIELYKGKDYNKLIEIVSNEKSFWQIKVMAIKELVKNNYYEAAGPFLKILQNYAEWGSEYSYDALYQAKDKLTIVLALIHAMRKF